MTSSMPVHRSDIRLLPDPARVLARLFVPGQELSLEQESRSSGVLSRILAIPEPQVAALLDDVRLRFGARHRDLPAVLGGHYDRVSHRVPGENRMSASRRLLIGACFTSEYSIEAAALLNPSVVKHPDQSGLEPGAVRFVLSLRAVGEGHISSLEFRTGIAGPGHLLRLDDPGRFLTAGRHRPTIYDRELFRNKLEQAGDTGESASYLVHRLPAQFDDETLTAALRALAGQRVTRHGSGRTSDLARRIAACNYEVEFDDRTPLAEQVLWPHAPSESRGIEDARFVRFVDDAGPRYYATYTAFDGDSVSPQLLATEDFHRFRITQLAGPAARDKGMALFPRRVGGRFVALSRWDRESTAITFSDDLRVWGRPIALQSPAQPWELIQLGNAGSPIETSAGWLVITHAVGPMREYTLGAILLDLVDPTKVIATLRTPLLRPEQDEREGYVPNVVYSCGSMAFGDQLLLPYGVSDSSVRFAFVDVPALLERLAADGPPETTRVNSAA